MFTRSARRSSAIHSPNIHSNATRLRRVPAHGSLTSAISLAMTFAVTIAVTIATLLPTDVLAASTQPSRTANTDKLPVGAVVLTRSMIAANAATNTAELLDTVAAINVRRDYGIAGSSTEVDMIGFGSRSHQNTLILINGRRINNSGNARFNLSNIPLNTIERIDILPGSGSVLHGNGASAGSINIITTVHDNALIEKAEDLENEPTTRIEHAGISASTGEYNTTGAEAYGAFEQHNNHGTSAATASWQALDSDGFRQNNAVRQRSGYADIQHTFSESRFYLSVLADETRLNLPGTRSVIPGTLNDFSQDPDGTNTPNDWEEQARLQLMPGVEVRLQPNLYITVDGNFSTAERQRFIQADRYTDADSNEQGVDLHLNGTHAAGLSVHQWTLGLDSDKTDTDTDTTAPATAALSTPSAADRRRDAWYLQDVISFSEQLSITLGARQSRVDTRYRSITSNQRDRHNIEMYQAGIQYRPLPHFALFANGERSARLANFDEIAEGSGMLKAQTGLLASTGARWTQGSQHSVLTLWRGTFNNEIRYDPLATPVGGPVNSGAYVNLGDKTLRQGLSLNSHWQLDEHLSITLNGSLQKAQFADGPLRGNNIPLVPHKTAYVQADWQATPWLLMTLSQRYVGKRKLDQDAGNNLASLSPYTWTDVSATFRHRAAWLKVGLYNLTDTLAADYGTATGTNNYDVLPLPDRHVLATFGLSY